jgi:tetratricopeptide (TPR) repeat protein
MPDIPLSPEDRVPENSDSPEPKPELTVEETEQLLLKYLHQKEEAMHDALFELACFYSYSGRQEVAKELFQQLIEQAMPPEEKAHYLLSMGQLMEQQRNFAQGVEYYLQAYALEPTDNNVWYLVHNNLGYSLNMLNRHPEAETYCRLAIQIDPERYNAYKNLGIALEGQEKFAEAAHFLLFATRLEPEDDRAIRQFFHLLIKQPTLLKEYPHLVPEMQKCTRLGHKSLSARIKNLLKEFNQ